MSNTTTTLAASTGRTCLQAQIAATANTNPQFITATEQQREVFSELLKELLCNDFEKALLKVQSRLLLDEEIDDGMKYHLKNLHRMTEKLDQVRCYFLDMPEEVDEHGAVFTSINPVYEGGAQ